MLLIIYYKYNNRYKLYNSDINIRMYYLYVYYPIYPTIKQGGYLYTFYFQNVSLICVIFYKKSLNYYK